jgi:F-type H+-transporting ATPase subunit delta
MASVHTLARPYARAAFELAKSANALADWSQKLGFSARVTEAPEVQQLIGNPKLDTAQLTQLVMPQGVPADSAFARFIGHVASNRRLPALAEIALQFDALKRDEERVLKVVARTAVPMAAAQADSLKAALKKRFARDIDLDNVIDATVIGGAVIDAGGVVIDGSVAGRLKALESALTL